MAQHKILSSSYWWLSALTVIIVGLFATVYTAYSAQRNIKESLLVRTDSLAGLIPTDTFINLNGSDEDLYNQSYQDLKAKLVHIRSINKDVRFIYLLANKDSAHQNSYFIVDSEDPASDDYSPPGQLYPEGDGDVAGIYEDNHSTVLPITRDRWGIWLSAFSPVKGSDGKVVAVLGLDIAAYTYYRDIALSAAIPFLLTLLVLMALFWSRRRAHYQQQYLTEKAFFLSFASHEIRSPLASVSWALQAVNSGTIPPEKFSLFLARTENSVRHILDTIEDVLNLQSTEALKNKKLTLSDENIHNLLQLIIDSLSLVSAEKGIDIQDQTDPADYNFSAPLDAALFKRVLSNLLINAIKYSPANQPVTVKFITHNSAWAIEIHNGGTPISEEDKAKIFKGYYRTKDAEASGQKGSGLGLMLSYDIVLRHGGTLELGNDKEGVTFRILMPSK